MIRTKIIATLGPASSQVETLLRLFEEGADICRLNFSHGTLADHLQMLKSIREAARKVAEPIAVLGDLCGPKIRLGQVADEEGSGGMKIGVGDVLRIQRQPIVGAKGRVSTTYARFVDDVRVGDRVLVEDGLLRFVVTDKTSDEVACACTAGGCSRAPRGSTCRTRRCRLGRSRRKTGSAQTGRSRMTWTTWRCRSFVGRRT